MYPSNHSNHNLNPPAADSNSPPCSTTEADCISFQSHPDPHPPHHLQCQVPLTSKLTYCWWKKKLHQLRLVVCPMLYKVLYTHSRWLAGFLPSTLFSRKKSSEPKYSDGRRANFSLNWRRADLNVMSKDSSESSPKSRKWVIPGSLWSVSLNW